MIRHLQPGDAPLFKTIRLEALRQEPAALASHYDDWVDLPDDEWESRLVTTPVFVSLKGRHPVGVMGLMRQRSSKMAHRATLIMVYVRADCRGQGRGKALLEAAIGHARGAGIRQLELAVSVENPGALAFYGTQGFQRIGLIPRGFWHDGRGIDEVLMARSLDE